MAHVYAARAVLPGMLERGSGYLLNTASAAGLLTDISAHAYSVTKHAAVAFAEWLAITYGARGIRVSVLCPQGVRTALLDGVSTSIGGQHLLVGMITYLQRKASDYDRWISGMRRMRDRIYGEPKL